MDVILIDAGLSTAVYPCRHLSLIRQLQLCHGSGRVRWHSPIRPFFPLTSDRAILAKRIKQREDFSDAVKRAVRDRAASICSNPKCLTPTVGADPSTDDGVTVIGVAAHICAASPGGPRYRATQTAASRTGIGNAIWLCANCATLIDKNAGRNFSVDALQKWKKDAEQRSANALLFRASLIRPDWLDRIHYCEYLNVPRLGGMLGNPNLVDEVGLDGSKGFRGQGMQVGQAAYWVEQAVCRAAIEAIPLDDVLPPSDDVVGQLISFDHRCYTKNGVDAGRTVRPSLLANFDPKKSPHFYIKGGATKVIFPYDPAWVTTSTAYSEFRQGNVRFAGLGLVKRVSDDLSEMFVSPLMVAFPRNEFMQAFYGPR